MTYLLILVLLLVVIAPFFAVLPSKAQKEKMRLRMQAMGMGISVEVTTMMDPVPDQEKYRTGSGKPLKPVLQIAAWRMARKKPVERGRIRWAEWAVVRKAKPAGEFPDTWQWENGKPADLDDRIVAFLREALGLLPPDVVKVEDKGSFVSVYWHERSGDEGFSAVTDFLVQYSRFCQTAGFGDEDDSTRPDGPAT